MTDGGTDAGRTDGQTDDKPIAITCFSIADARKNEKRNPASNTVSKKVEVTCLYVTTYLQPTLRDRVTLIYDLLTSKLHQFKLVL